jgi:hypothetical protein
VSAGGGWSGDLVAILMVRVSVKMGMGSRGGFIGNGDGEGGGRGGI